MKKIIISVGLFAALLNAENNFYENGDANLKIGTLGVGVEYAMPYNQNIDFRVGFNKFSYDTSGTESDINYDIDLDLQTFSLIADYKPFDNGFRISGGFMYNQNGINFDGKPTANQFTINDVTYSANDVGSLDGNVDFNNFAPYLGMGYKSVMTKSGDWSFTSELGVLFQGDPKTSLNATCTSNNAALCTQLENDVKQEQSQLEDEIDGFNMYPVFSIGFAYKF